MCVRERFGFRVGQRHNANANTKHVKIIITSNKPADVSIHDDSFKWEVNEEIVGTATYERNIRENSGLSVSAITDAWHAQTTIRVYEDGSLVAQDAGLQRQRDSDMVMILALLVLIVAWSKGKRRA